MNSQMIRVLLIEDNPGDARLTQVELSDAQFVGWDLPRFDIVWVDTLAEGLTRLDAAAAGERDPFDAVLTDLDLPDSRAGETFAALREHFPHLPIVVLTGREDAELARASVRAGAQDYLFKNEVTGSLLAHALTYAIERQQVKDALEDAHNELEQRVETRTAELQEANQALRTEVAAHQRTEAALQESVALLQATLDATGDSIIAVGKDGRTVTYNRSMEALFDLPQGWLEEPSLAARMDQVKPQLKHPDEAFARIQALYDDWELEQRDLLEFKDGRVYERYTAPYYIEGEGEGRVWSFRDITARRHAKRALHERESQYRLLFEMINDMVFIHPLITEDRGQHFTEVNDVTCRALGYTREELLRLSPLDIVTDQDLRAVPEEREALTDEGRLLFEKTLVTKTGEHISVELHARLFEHDGQSMVLSIARDITERKQMEEALRESKARYRVISELTSDFAYAVRVAPDGTYVPEWETKSLDFFTGYSRSAMQDQGGWQSLIHPDDRQAAQQYFQTLLAGEANVIEFRIVTPDGETRWLRNHGRPVWDDGAGRVVRIIGAAQDIMDRKRAEEALQERVKELTCLYAVSRDLHRDLPVDVLCQRVIERLVPAMQFPGITVPVIDLHGKRFTSGSYTEGLSRGFYEDIHVDGEVWGRLWVYYTEEKPFLVPEEQNLVRGVAEALGMWLERKRTEQALRESNEKLTLLFDSLPVGVSVLNQDRNVVKQNRALGQILAMTAEGLARGDYRHRRYLRADGSLMPLEAFPSARVLNGEAAVYNTEIGVEKEDGGVVWTSVSAVGCALADWRVVIVTTDVTDRKQMEESLREGEARYRRLLNTLQEGVWVIDNEACTTFVNPRMAAMLGYTVEAMQGQSLFAFMEEADVEMAERNLARRQEGVEEQHEFRFLHKDGHYIHTLIETAPILDEAGHYEGAVAGIIDITERKHIEEALRESQRLLSKAETLARMGSWEWDLAEDVFTLSEGWLRVHGCQEGQLSRKHLLSIAHPDDRQRIKDALERSLAQGVPYNIEHRIIRQDNGEVRVVRAYGEVVYDGETPVEMYGAAQDITEQSRAQEALERVRYSIDRVSDSVLWVDKDGNFIDVNDAACDNLGYTREELLTLGVPDVDPNFPHEVWTAHWAEAVKCGTMTLESIHRTKDGRQIPVEVMIHNQQFGDTRYNCVLARDITARKREEENMRRYQNIVSSTPDGIAFLDDAYRYRIANAAYERFSGTKREQFIGLTVAEYLGEEVFQRAVKPHFDRCLQGETVSYRDWFDYPTLGRRFVEVTYFPYRDAHDRIVGVVSSTRDITDRKRVEDALRESEERFRKSFDTESIAMAISRYRDGVYLDANPGFLKMTGYAYDEIVGHTSQALNFLSSSQRQALLVGLEEQGRLHNQELTFLTKDGTLRTILFSIGPIILSGEACLLATMVDITKRKQMEEALRESEEKYRRLVEGAPSILYIYSDQRGALYWSQRVQDVLGYAPEDLVEDPYLWHDAIHPDDLAAVDKVIAAGIKGVSFDLEYRIQDTDGHWHWFRDRFIGSRQVGDEHIIEGLATDITERKQAEEASHRYTERLQIEHEIDTAILAAQSPEEIARAALMHLHHLIPCPRASITEIDLAQQQGRDMLVFVDRELQTKDMAWHPLTDAGEHLAEIIQKGQPYIVQDIAALETLTPLEKALQASGMRAYVSVPLLGQDAPVGTLNMASEMPDFFQPDHIVILQEVAASLAVALRQARLLEQTRQDAETRALLLREVNHRVKNNLDAIIGLLYVERRHAPPEARAAFQPIMDDLNQRIMGLAQVHHMLSAAEWRPLELSKLAEQLIHTAIRNSLHDARVIVDVAPSPVRVSPGQAHHLALVISELTTNTLKYAVAGRDTVRIAVCIAQEDDVITLIYRNDGPGYPEDVLRLARYNAGLDIVQKIVRKNLMGEVVLCNDDGAVTEMRFKVEDSI